MRFRSFMEALKGKQHKIDKNKNGKIDAHDFKLLRKEETEQADESYDFNRAALAKQRLQNLRHAGRKVRGATLANLMRAAGIREEEMDDQDLDQLDEVLGKDAAASDWIHDFVHSTNPKFEGKTKKERIKMALGAYYGKQNEKNLRVEETDTSEKNEMAETQLHFIKYAAEEILDYIKMGGEVEEWYQNKLSKVQSEVESLHSYIEGESRRTGLKEQSISVIDELNKSTLQSYVDKAGKEASDSLVKSSKHASLASSASRTGSTRLATVNQKLADKHQTHANKRIAGMIKATGKLKEEYDEEGNITYSKLSYKDFASQLLEYITGPGGVTRIQGRGYGTAKGSKYGSTDYDSEHLDKNDDEHETSQPQKRGRGRPAGSTSGARGPRIK